MMNIKTIAKNWLLNNGYSELDNNFQDRLESLSETIYQVYSHEGFASYDDIEYDPNFGDDKICGCGHKYYRHFDSYDNMAPLRCKYCGCYEFNDKMAIAYTIGHTQSYKTAIKDNPKNCLKLGKNKDYAGGWIWKTSKEAEEFLDSLEFMEVKWEDGKSRNPRKFSVFKVILANGFEKDTAPIPGTNRFNLLVDSKFEEL